MARLRGRLWLQGAIAKFTLDCVVGACLASAACTSPGPVTLRGGSSDAPSPPPAMGDGDASSMMGPPNTTADGDGAAQQVDADSTLPQSNDAAAPGADGPAPIDSTPSPPVPNPVRDAFLSMLRAIAQPIPALAPALMPATTSNGVLRQDFSFASTPTWRVPGTLRKSASAVGRLSVAIVLHETGADRESGNVLDIVNAMVGRGFLAVAISGRYFGAGGGNPAYIAAIKAADASPGHDYPFLYDTVWDAMCLIDYLVTRDDVDPQRIGMTGISKGGMETTLAAFADPRVAAAAPIIGVQSFEWGLENNAFQARALSLGDAVPNPTVAASVRLFYDRVAPGLLEMFDGPQVLPLVAPRPLIVIAGNQDPRNAIGGVKVVMDATNAAYVRAGAGDRVKLFTADVGHDGAYAPFHQAAEMWLDQWLGNHPGADQ
jgi:dienelactone hydrolase